MSIFVIGKVGHLRVGTEVYVFPATVGRKFLSDEPVKIDASISVKTGYGSRQSTTLVRGKARESKGFYARVFPTDAEEGLQALDNRIKEKENELALLREERQEYLAANVVRGELITKKHAKEETHE